MTLQQRLTIKLSYATLIPKITENEHVNFIVYTFNNEHLEFSLNTLSLLDDPDILCAVMHRVVCWANNICAKRV